MVALGVVCMLLLAVVSCEASKEPYATPLKGTNWKLVGVVDPRTGILEELEPKDCEKCFTLRFETNRIFYARGIKLTLRVDMDNIPDMSPNILWCDFYEGEDFCDHERFRDAVSVVGSYSATREELRLNTYARGDPALGLIWYALFKRIDL